MFTSVKDVTNLLPELQAMALGIAQVRYWDLGKKYRLMLAGMEREYPATASGEKNIDLANIVLGQYSYMDGFVIDRESEQIANAWFDFCKEHDGWNFKVFDPCDIRMMFSGQLPAEGR